MKRIAVVASLAAALAALSSAPVPAQTKQSEKPAATGTAPRLVQNIPASRKGKRSRKDVDARHCLKLATNLEIHRCALKYR